ncbi:hypothetical protein GQ457_05G015080 [Hibiscus cannabinus]
MTRGNPSGPLLPSEPEIERFFKQRRRTQREQNIMYALGHQGEDPVGDQDNHNAEANGNVGNGGNAPRPSAIRDHLNPILDDLNPGIVAPEIQAAHFELKPVMFNMLNSIGQFGGMPHEDARQHIRNFLEVCDSFRQQGVHEDVLKIKLFPYSLRDRARAWLSGVPASSMESWSDLCKSFLLRYNPPTMNTQLRNDIASFRQANDESMYECWDRYKSLLRKCSNHGFRDWTQVVMFYNGVNAPTRMMLDASANGTLLDKSPSEAFDILDRIANNDYQFPSLRLGTGRKAPEVLELDSKDSVAAQLSAITNMLKSLQRSNEVKDMKASSSACLLCHGNHHEHECPSNQESINYVGNQNRATVLKFRSDRRDGDDESYVLVLSSFRTGDKPRWPAANDWRLLDSFRGPWRLPLGRRVKEEEEGDEGCRSMVPARRKSRRSCVGRRLCRERLGFCWRILRFKVGRETEKKRVLPPLCQPNRVTRFTTRTRIRPHQHWRAGPAEGLRPNARSSPIPGLRPNPRFYSNHKDHDARTLCNNEESRGFESSSLRALEGQVGQIASALQECQQGRLPSDTQVTKAHNREHCSALTLRSGTQINVQDKFGGKNEEDSNPNTKKAEEELQEEALVEKDKCEGSTSESVEVANKNATAKATPTPAVEEVRPPPPFPQRLKKHKDDIQFKKFVDILDQLHINVPFLEAVEQMPTYAKFLKEIVTKKRRVEKNETIAATKEYCSSLSNLPPKRKDPGSFIIPCAIGENFVGKALCDLGSSVNLMPKAIFLKLGMGNVRPTSVILQLADRSHVRPEGRVEDAIVRVDKFVFPVDFLILDCEVDANAPIILGRPFLATGRILIDCEKGELTMRVADQSVTVNVFRTLKYVDDSSECHHILEMESLLEEEADQFCQSKFIQLADYERLIQLEDDKESESFPLEVHQSSLLSARSGIHFEPLNFDEFIPPKPSLQHSPTLELKTLPRHLKYAYLGSDETLPVIISSNITPDQERSLLSVLSQHKGAIRWTMADLKGISPTICMHKILLEDCHGNSIEPQRRLNPVMKNVVMKEIIKWLDAGVIYPISNSSWVSPVQCVPKKGGTTVVTNEENELLTTRTVTGWRICMDYRKLNKATKKDHFPLPFIDQMRMPFGLCNAPVTFHIFSDMVEDFLEIFMDDFSVSGDDFQKCLGNLARVLKRCEEADLVLNWEKCHFMVTEGIVLGHKISHKGIEVDNAKIEVIENAFWTL